jgi:hypothetical protein
LDFGLKKVCSALSIENPKSQIHNGESGYLPGNFFAHDMFRVKTFEAAGHIERPVFFEREQGVFAF